jgi:alpha-glucosidase
MLPNSLLFACCVLTAPAAIATSHKVTAPAGDLAVNVDTGAEHLAFTVFYRGAVVSGPNRIGLRLAGAGELGARPQLIGVERSASDAWIEPVVRQKAARVRDHHNAVTLSFTGGYAVEFRAYDDGFGYRFLTALDGAIDVAGERLNLQFPDGATARFPEEISWNSNNQRTFLPVSLAELDVSRLASLPVLVTVPDVARVLISESDLFDYPALWLRGGPGASLAADFPRVVLDAVPNPRRADRTQLIVREAPYIARTDGSRAFPWRAFIVSDRDGALIESDLVFLLARPPQFADTAWIRPGRVAWDWYSALNIYGVDFKSGVNNATYRHYIDFAAEYGLEYIILDEGWSASTTDVAACHPDIDVPALVAYGAERGVGIILWSLWGPVDRDMEALFDLWQSWGVKGMKLDFMLRSDQAMVNFYNRVARAAAERRLLVNFHGCFKPTGLIRSYPNVLTYEGVLGNEQNKWSRLITPEHNLVLPFTRMAAGPMDYTPGAMANAQPHNFVVSYERPMAMGTRCHEVAKYIVFESPLQMLCDTPSRYRREAATTAFLARIPAVWDETRVLAAAVGEHVVIARRSGAAWYLAAMTDENARSFSLDLGFLPEPVYAAEIMRDGVNADRFAEDYVKSTARLNRGEPLRIELAPAGGWAAILTPVRPAPGEPGASISAPPPYVGVTGFMRRAEVEAALAALPEKPDTHKLQVGVLVTDRTLRGAANDKPGRYPPREHLGVIFNDDPRALNIVHFATASPDRLADQLADVVRRAGPHLHGFQVNMTRPPIAQLEAFRQRHPGLVFILQLRPDLLAAHAGDLDRVIEAELQAYRHVVDYLFYDMSLGWGIPLDVAASTAAVRKLRAAFPGLGIGVAGGLNAEQLHRIASLAGAFPMLCIDAETGMRSGDARDALDLDRVTRYIRGAYAIFQ